MCWFVKLLSTENTHLVLEKFKDTKWAISSRKSTDSQCNVWPTKRQTMKQ